MSFKVKNEGISKETIDIFKRIVVEDIQKYKKYVSEQKDITLIFLKSMLYVESIIKTINSRLYDKSFEEKTLGINLRYTKLIHEDNLMKSIEFLDKIKKIRDDIAHKLEYELEKDLRFIKIFKIIESDSFEDKKYKISLYFGDVVNGFLYIKVGMEILDDFIYYDKKKIKII